MRAILTWHSIDPSGSPISVSREDFVRQVEWIAANGVRVVPLAGLLALPNTADAAAITFDDAIANIATEALPILAERGWPATIFVVTNRTGLDNLWEAGARGRTPTLPLLDWDSLGGLAAQGFEIAAHTRRHPALPACDPDQLVEELEGCAEDMERRLGRRPQSLAYPYGAVNAAVASEAARTFRLACTTELRPLGRRERAELLPRLDAGYFRGRVLRARWGSLGFRRYFAVRRGLRALRKAVA